MADKVKLIPLTTHPDQRGFFREVLRASNGVEFAQLSHSKMGQGVIKAWHIHKRQTDYWYVVGGIVLAVTCDVKLRECQEFLLGDDHPPGVLVIPPGVAHGCKVLQGPAHLLYVTSQEYDGSDEGRIPFDALGYDWHKQEIW